ncbi:uncharacterized protein LOC114793387 [Denticeps clupeoides]|uniref:uncharacterized protein LOC114793387 n=1 Tax=Denticeps clupeoides TaxID=299321 RepID=UPI0010A4F8AF|nr:uncharacterized protein LOC114793387 [Denticeps clupeoides]
MSPPVDLLLLSGLWTLSASDPSVAGHRYHYVGEAKTWTDAQAFCRQNYVDLAAIAGPDEAAAASAQVPAGDRVWIGLYDDVGSWKWSAGGDALTGFANWWDGEPNNLASSEHCVQIHSSGRWIDLDCSVPKPFVCFNEVGSVRFVLVPDPKSWSEARSYCRAHHTDLATVRNQPENQQVQALLPAPGGAWIGLSRDAWRWSDQDESSFANWIPGEPNNFLGRAESCVEMWTWTSGQWNDEVCSALRPFLCHDVVDGPGRRNQAIRSSVTCEGDEGKIDCGTEAIRIVTANYGRTDAVTCSDGRPLGQISLADCHAPNSFTVTDQKCRGKSSCAVQSSNAAFGDPCFGTYKYLNVTYSCVQSPTAKVTCNEDSMTVEVEKSGVIGPHEDHLRLNDPSCTLYSDATRVLATFSLSTCGTLMEEDEDNIVFKNEIVSSDEAHDIITRRNEVEIQFYCKYPKKGLVTVQFQAHRPPLTFVQNGFGTFTYQFEFFATKSFVKMRDPQSYPLVYELHDMMFMQIESRSSVPNTELFIESCSAAPSDGQEEALTYPIIRDGCKVDQTVKFYTSHQSKVQLEMEAFKFIGLHDQVFVTCSVILCDAGNPRSRCARGCTDTGHSLSKRGAVLQTASHLISQGPLRLRRSSTGLVGDGPSPDLNLLLVAGCLLAAVGMVCGVTLYKTRRSEFRYARLPSALL